MLARSKWRHGKGLTSAPGRSQVCCAGMAQTEVERFVGPQVDLLSFLLDHRQPTVEVCFSRHSTCSADCHGPSTTPLDASFTRPLLDCSSRVRFLRRLQSLLPSAGRSTWTTLCTNWSRCMAHSTCLQTRHGLEIGGAARPTWFDRSHGSQLGVDL